MDESLKKLINQRGKKLVDIEAQETWDKEQIESVTLIFDDGTRCRISASSEKGCWECDMDGSLNDYLTFFVKENT